VVVGGDVGARRFDNGLRWPDGQVKNWGNQALERSVVANRRCHGQAEGSLWWGMDVDELWLMVNMEEKDRVCDI
jgi:hypothetical protein